MFSGFEVLTAVLCLLGYTLCSPLEVIQRFRGICHLHCQGWRISQEQETSMSRFLLVSCFAYSLADFQQTTWNCIIEDKSLQLHVFSYSFCYMYKVYTLIIAAVKVEFQIKCSYCILENWYYSGTMVSLFLQAATGITQGCRVAS
jgi:hypothetical protein